MGWIEENYKITEEMAIERLESIESELSFILDKADFKGELYNLIWDLQIEIKEILK